MGYMLDLVEECMLLVTVFLPEEGIHSGIPGTMCPPLHLVKKRGKCDPGHNLVLRYEQKGSLHKKRTCIYLGPGAARSQLPQSVFPLKPLTMAQPLQPTYVLRTPSLDSECANGRSFLITWSNPLHFPGE